MPLKDIRPRHVYVASVAAFVLLAGFEGARMAVGHDPALAASRHAQPAPTAQPYLVDPNDPQGGFIDPNAAPQGGLDPSQVPQPETRLS